jgi:hypothetical protein
MSRFASGARRPAKSARWGPVFRRALAPFRCGFSARVNAWSSGAEVEERLTLCARILCSEAWRRLTSRASSQSKNMGANVGRVKDPKDCGEGASSGSFTAFRMTAGTCNGKGNCSCDCNCGCNCDCGCGCGRSILLRVRMTRNIGGYGGCELQRRAVRSVGGGGFAGGFEGFSEED